MDYEDSRSAYEDALNNAFTAFRSHINSHNKAEWRPVAPSAAAKSATTTKLAEPVNGLHLPTNVAVHRKTTKTGDVIRATADVAASEPVNLAAFAALLQVPEARRQWDTLVERATMLEQIDAQTQIVKTDFRLGWPINPRDAVTISRTVSDDSTVVHVATSLPRTPVEPSFLRPAPPYVRAEIALFAWRIHLRPLAPGAPPAQRTIRIQLLWQWQLKGAAVANQYQHASALVKAFVEQVRKHGVALPLLTGFGRECDVATSTCELDRDALSIDYTVLHEAGVAALGRRQHEGAEELAAMKEARRLERSIEILLPISEGWDVTLRCHGLGDKVDASYRTSLERFAHNDVPYAVLRFVHAKLNQADQLVRVKLTMARLVGGTSIRINGERTDITTVEPRDPSSSYRRMIDDAATSANISLDSREPGTSVGETIESEPRPSPAVALKARATALLIRRCYNYFTSLLQEPEEKWRYLFEARGVGVGQLASPDPTVLIYRAEKTIVGVNIWDIYSALLAPGIRTLWDAQNESVTLLDDLGESTALWHVVTKAVWPAWARDTILVQTSYKSTNSIHVFAFSTTDDDLFPAIPSPQASIIRAQVDVQGWSIEALSPTTTRIALIEQSDSRGWSTKSWTPQQMSNMVAGLGEYALRNGGPPMITKQLGAQLLVLRYEQEKGSLKAEYCVRRGGTRGANVTPVVLTATTAEGEEGADFRAIVQESPPMLECEIRCNVDHWSPCADITIDPPPAKISCLHRHRLSANGSGFWITFEHESVLLADNERVTLLVRKGPSKEKSGIVVNGKRQRVEAEVLAEDDVKMLAGQKRMRALPVPLDRSSMTVPPAAPSPTTATRPASPANTPIVAAPKASNDQAEAAEAARPSRIAPLGSALEALAALQTFHVEQAGAVETTTGPATWTPSGYRTSRRMFEPLSSTHLVYRSEKIVEKTSAEELVALLACSSARHHWDDRIAKCVDLETFGNSFKTSVMTTRGAMLAFRPRTFYVASAAAFMQVPSTSATSSTANVYMLAMASFEPPEGFPTAALNAQGTPVGRILLDGWILESLDPYAGDGHPIPSTRCLYFTSIDYAGSMPTSVASMMHADPGRTIDGLERFIRQRRVPRLLTPSWSIEAVGSLASGTKIGSGSGEVALIEGQRFVWQIREGGANALHLLSEYDAATSTYSAVLARLPKPRVPRPGSHRSTTSVDPANGILHRPSVNDLRKQASLSTLRTMASRTALRGGSGDGEHVNGEGDMIVVECVLPSTRWTVSIAAAWASPSSAASTDVTNAAERETLPWRARVSAMRGDRASQAFSAIPEASAPYLLQVTLPTAQYRERPASDPLGADAAPMEAPTWYKRLGTDTLLVAINIVDETGTSPSSTGAHITFEGKKLTVPLNEKASNSTVDDVESLRCPQLSRVLAKRKPGTIESSEMPVMLVNPIARTRLACSDKTRAVDESKTLTAVSVASTRAGTPVAGYATPLNGVTPGPTVEGNKAAVESTAIKESTVLSRSLEALDPSRMTVPPFFGEPRFSLGAVLVIALVAFLLGSLLRALVGPTDFVLEATTAEGIVDVRLLQALHPGRHWRPARRVLDFRFPRFLSRSEFMCAAVERST